MKTRIFLFILLCLTLANINAQDNKDDLSNSKELTGIWEINLGDSYETVKAVMQKRGWTVSSMPSNEKKAIKNRESLGLDPRPTYTFKKENGTFVNQIVSKIKFIFFQNKLYEIQICFYDHNYKNRINSELIETTFRSVYSLDFEKQDRTEYTSDSSVISSEWSATKEIYHAKNSNMVTLSKTSYWSKWQGDISTSFSLRICIFSKSVKDKVENEILKEISEDIKSGNELNGIFDSNLGDNKDTVIASMTKRKWSIKERDGKKNETIIFTKKNGTYGLFQLPERGIELFFKNEILESINILFDSYITDLGSEEFLVKKGNFELCFYELMERIKRIYNLDYIEEKEIEKSNSDSSKYIHQYKIFHNSNSNIISFINHKNGDFYEINISKSLYPEELEELKEQQRLEELTNDL